MTSRQETRIESREKTVTVYTCDFCGQDDLSRGDIQKARLSPRITHTAEAEMIASKTPTRREPRHTERDAVARSKRYVELEDDGLIHLCGLCAGKLFPDAGDGDGS